MVEVCEGECMGRSPRDEPLTLMRCHSFMKPWKVVSRIKVIVAIGSLLKAMNMNLQCTRVLHEVLLVPIVEKK